MSTKPNDLPSVILLACSVLVALFIVIGTIENHDEEHKARAKEELAALLKDSYIQGFEAGIKEGSAQGYQLAYEYFFPGTSLRLQGFAHKLFKILIWGGALKICISGCWGLFILVTKASGPLHALGRIFFCALGFIATTLVSARNNLRHLAEAKLLMPGAFGGLDQLGWTVPAAIVFWYASFKIHFFFRETHTPLVDILSAVLLSSGLTFLLPILFGLYFNVPDISRYVAASIFAGAFIGGFGHLAVVLLAGSPRSPR